LFNLQATHFPDSFPIDIMHLIYENIASYIFQHWRGNFFKKGLNDQNNGDYVLSNAQWNEIGNEMHSIRKMIPTYLGRPPRNIVLYHNGYKAEEWAAWITMYSLPLLKGRMQERHYQGWAYFVKAVCLCKKLTLTDQELNNIRLLFRSFYDYYEV
jgi:hypothetical protein